MSIYEKPVRLLLKDFVTTQNIAVRQIISRDQVISWFKGNYPRIQLGTISAHLLRMSINAPSRIHYRTSPIGDDDLFYQIDGNHFRLYEKGNDPLPIYIKSVNGNESGGQMGHSYIQDENLDDSPEELSQQTGFAYESDLRNFLAKNLTIIESGLKLYQDEGISGIEFPVGGRFIDLLAIDRHNNYVVIELKVSKGYDRVIGNY